MNNPNWGVIEVRDDNGKFISYHVMPMVKLGTESVPSAAHDMTDACHCHPFFTLNDHGFEVWHHFDPTHPGGMGYDEYVAKRRAAMKEAQEVSFSVKRCNGRVQ